MILTLLTGLALYVAPDTRVLSLAFSADSKELLVGKAGSVERWDVATKSKKSAVAFPNQNVTCVGFLGDGYVVATLQPSTPEKVGGKGKVFVLDKNLLTTGEKPGHHIFAKVKEEFFTADGEQWDDGSVLDAKGKELLSQLPGFVCGLACHGDYVAVGTTGRAVMLYNRRTKASALLPVLFRGTNNSLAFVGEKLAVLGSNGSLIVCSLAGKVVDNVATKGVCLAANQDMVLVATQDGDLEAFAFTGKEHAASFRRGRVHKDKIFAVALSPDGKWMASGGLDGQVILTPIPPR